MLQCNVVGVIAAARRREAAMPGHRATMFFARFFVIPAKAGIQSKRTVVVQPLLLPWIPAFAGMTEENYCAATFGSPNCSAASRA
jgi:hypothetical protein